MQNLKVIENELVPVYETSTGEKVVYGSELHEILRVKSPYREWSQRRLKDCDALEKEDFQAVEISTPSGQTKKDHIIKLDTAKEMAMLERNLKGKQVRRYFIQIEKKYKVIKPRTALEQLQLQSQAILEVNDKIDEVKKDLEDFKQDMPLLSIECDRITTVVRKVGTRVLGGKESNAYHDKSLSAKVYMDIYRELKRQFQVTSYKSIKRSQCDTAISIIENYRLPVALKEQIQSSNAQMNMEEM